MLIAGASAVLAVPRPVAPVELPEPLLEPRALERVARADRALAEDAEAARLDTDVRAVGSAMRAYGLADAAGEDGNLMTERRNVASAAERGRAQGDAAMARLRAYQLRSFLRELRRWETSGEESGELRELGGRFLETARRDGWIEGRRLIMDEPVRAALFKKRWDELTLLRGAPFDPTPQESLALARFLFLHPPQEVPRGRDAPQGRAAEQRVAFNMEQYRLRKIEELRALDPSYPAHLARGVIFYRLRRYPMAVESFRRHLEAHPDGPYTVRAQNYLRAALGAATDEL